MKLNWIDILCNAIKGRPTSWIPLGYEKTEFKSPVDGKPYKVDMYSPSEWRNASDEVYGALIIAMEDAGIFKSIFKKEVD
jgi:hypothetical protein